jgi:hypothetical protein
MNECNDQGMKLAAYTVFRISSRIIDESLIMKMQLEKSGLVIVGITRLVYTELNFE